jgi:SP family arabinose:H+ symporter-like MFS transporter
MAEANATPGWQMKEEIAQEKVGGVYVYLIAFVAAAGGFNFGFDIVLMSGALLYLEPYFSLSGPDMAWAKGFTMTSAMYGALVGFVAGSRLADGLGRQRTLLVAAVLLLIGAAGSTLADTLPVWNVARIVGGVGAGLAALVSPLYISEIAPARQRGPLVTVNQMAIVLGAFLAIMVTYVIANYSVARPEWAVVASTVGLLGTPADHHLLPAVAALLPPSDCWRWMFASAGVPTLLFLVGLCFVPRSPRWLVMKGRPEEARAVLTRIGGRAHADEELRAIAASLAEEAGGFAELFRPGMRMALLIAVGLALFQQLAGVSTLIGYAPTIFQSAGVSSSTQAIGNTVILRIWDIGWTLFALFYVEKLGRRPLLLWGVLGMALGQFLMGLNFFYGWPPKMTLIVFFLCEAAYDVSLAPLTWLIMSEIFPTRIRAGGMAVAAFMLQVSALALGQAFPPMIENFKKWFGTEAGAYWVFAGFCVAAWAFSYYLVPETKGRTLEQIAEWWSRKPKEVAA